jgi:hypothetical protein
MTSNRASKVFLGGVAQNPKLGMHYGAQARAGCPEWLIRRRVLGGGGDFPLQLTL